MSYGLQISASGVMTSMYAQDVYANNLANIDTPGFKPDIPYRLPRQDVRDEDHLPFLPSDKLLERLGGGTLLNPNRVDFTQGALKDTGNPLDVAIAGEGFFVVKVESDKQGDRIRLTRDGRMTRNALGQLVMSATGLPVLDAQNRPITLGPGKVTISEDGTVCAGGRECGQIQMVEVQDKTGLTKIGHSLFSADANTLSSTGKASGTIRQGVYEDSSAEEVKMLMRMTDAGRDVESNVSMIQQHDKMMDRAINGLGRVA
jgi:flagellar basal-body rod protein FlgG